MKLIQENGNMGKEIGNNIILMITKLKCRFLQLSPKNYSIEHKH